MGYFQEACEREVIINFDDASDMANLYTANKVWIRKMDKLVAEHPESFKFRRQETYKGEVIANRYWVCTKRIYFRSDRGYGCRAQG